MLFIHSTPAALCPHVEWAVGAILDCQINFDWSEQPAERGSRRAEVSWVGRAGAGAELASKLAGFQRLRFEVTEDPSPGADGQRFSYTPSLGAFSATVGVHGDILVGEDRIKRAVANDALGGESIHQALEKLLGIPWDDELDVFRYASDDVPVRWLHQVV
ncbi:DUF3145 domain-containing protein [Tessaracoccus sp. OS52]|uniref:DUF3145 domain-containing protein n=1 Tax=Tessaracoccus sp. OS52 TaxID=2886691 RepID=UPI0021059C47